MSLATIVELYRACERPPLNNGDFVCTTGFTKIKAIVKRVSEEETVRFISIIIDEQDFLDEELPANGKQISFHLRLATGSSNRFHSNLAELLETEPEISRGHVPGDFYLVEEDFYSADTNKPSNIKALDKICQLISGLSKLAHYHDEKASNNFMRLVFLQPTEGSGLASVVLETKVTPAILDTATDFSPRLVKELSESSASNDPHYLPKIGVFSTSLAAFIRSSPHAFEHLVAHWQQFVESYQRDLSTYLSGFAFHKAKKEVAEAELKIAGEFSKVLSEITGKLLSIPVTFLAVAAIISTESLLQRLLLLTGVMVAAVVVSRLVENQRRQFDRIKHAKNLVLGAIEGRKENYPKELADSIDGMTINLKKNEESLGCSLTLFAFLSWLPVAVALIYLLFIYFDDIRESISILIDIFSSLYGMQYGQ